MIGERIRSPSPNPSQDSTALHVVTARPVKVESEGTALHVVTARPVKAGLETVHRVKVGLETAHLAEIEIVLSATVIAEAQGARMSRVRQV